MTRFFIALICGAGFGVVAAAGVLGVWRQTRRDIPARHITAEAELIVERETSAMLGHMLHLAHGVEAHPSCAICHRERVGS